MSAVTSATPATELAALYAAARLPCQIEAGPRGLVIYAATPLRAAAVARRLCAVVRERDPRAVVSAAPQFDADEPDATAWWTTVDLSWEVF